MAPPPWLERLRSRLVPAPTLGQAWEREEQRRRLAAYLTDPSLPFAAQETRGEGLGGTPGIAAALEGHRHAFEKRHDRAAEAFHRAVLAMPTQEDEADDAARHLRLCRSLAMMLLARSAVRAGLADKAWPELGTADAIAAEAVAREPMQLHLHFEHAELLVERGRAAAAFALLLEARALAAAPPMRMKLAAAAMDAAAASDDAALLDRAEAAFVAPLLAPGRDDGPKDSGRSDAAVRDWLWFVAFHAGRVAYMRAMLSAREDVPARKFAGVAARRFSRAGVLAATTQSLPAETAQAIGNWRRSSLRLVAQHALAAGRPVLAARRLAETGEPEGAAMAERLRDWVRSGRPPRQAALALLAGEPVEETERFAFDVLSRTASSWREEGRVAMAIPAEPIVVGAAAPLLVDGALANRLLHDEVLPSIRRLRERLRQRYGLALPSVRLRGDGAEPGSARAILDGVEELTLAIPPDCHLVAASMSQGGVPAPLIEGEPYRWAPGDASPRGRDILPADFVLIGLLEDAFLRRMATHLGLDVAATILSDLPAAMLKPAVRALRALIAERMPVGLPEMSAMLRERLDAGDEPSAIVARLRAAPGFRRHLWGNEKWRTPITLDAKDVEVLSRRSDWPLDTDAQARLEADVSARVRDVAEPVLVVSSPALRARLASALAPRFSGFPVLAESEREERR